jgi:hypothetical protein
MLFAAQGIRPGQVSMDLHIKTCFKCDSESRVLNVFIYLLQAYNTYTAISACFVSVGSLN